MTQRNDLQRLVHNASQANIKTFTRLLTRKPVVVMGKENHI